MTPRQFAAVFTILYALAIYIANAPLHGLDWACCAVGLAAAPIFAYNLAMLLLKWKALMPAMPWD